MRRAVAVALLALGFLALPLVPRADAATAAVGLAPAATGTGTVDAAGRVTPLGGAPALGSVTTPLRHPIVGMASTPSRAGYRLVAADGGIFSFGDAVFRGSTGAIRLARPIVGMARTATGRGYSLVAGDGGVFSFGDATYAGRSLGATAIVTAGGGYRVAGTDGSVATFVPGATPSVTRPRRSARHGSDDRSR